MSIVHVSTIYVSSHDIMYPENPEGILIYYISHLIYVILYEHGILYLSDNIKTQTRNPFYHKRANSWPQTHSDGAELLTVGQHTTLILAPVSLAVSRASACLVSARLASLFCFSEFIASVSL